MPSLQGKFDNDELAKPFQVSPIVENQSHSILDSNRIKANTDLMPMAGGKLDTNDLAAPSLSSMHHNIIHSNPAHQIVSARPGGAGP